MKTTYSLDIILLLMLMASAWLCYFFHSGKINQADEIPNKKSHNQLWRLYPASLVRQAGLLAQRNMLLYWSIKAVSLLLSVLLLSSFLTLTVAANIAICVLAFFLLDIWLLAKRQSRKQIIDVTVEYFISLLLVYLQSGNNLSQSFRLAAQYGLTQQNPLAQELMLVASELDAGRDRHRAFTALAQRTGVKNLTKLATIIQVGMNMGAPLINSLQSQLATIRLQHEERITAKINRKSLETMLPMLLVCFPMFLVLVFFPAAIQIMDVMMLLSEML